MANAHPRLRELTYTLYRIFRNPSAIIRYCDRIIDMDRDPDHLAITGHGFINRIIYNFINQMVQPGYSG